MIENMTPDRIANSIMQDTNYTGHYLLVEGIKDSKLYSKFFDSSTTRIKETFGCEKLKEVYEILDSRGFLRKLGILDKDFHQLTNTLISKNDIFYTDDHDIEIMIVKTDALENVIKMYADKEKIEKFEKKKKNTIRNEIFSLCDNIGYLKLANQKHNLGLVFKPKTPDGNTIKYNDFISDKLVFEGKIKLIQSVINFSNNKSSKIKNRTEIEAKYDLESKTQYNSDLLSNGHDFSNILFLCLKKTLRSTSKMIRDGNCVENSLILAYEYEEFKSTQLYTSILNWQNTNGLKLLK
jgi:hypothetical protein